MNESGGQSPQKIWSQYSKGVSYNTSINLYDTVEQNENFYLGKQWEGVQSNGLPTPVFNVIEQIVGHLVSMLVTDNIKIQASGMDMTGKMPQAKIDRICDIVNAQFDRLTESEKLAAKIREVMRMCAVDGDGCLYFYFDMDKVTGQPVNGDIGIEIVENTRVIFGNPNSNRVEKQPFIIIARREMAEDIKRRAKTFHGEPDFVKPDSDDLYSANETEAGDRATVLIKFWKVYNPDGTLKTVKAVECTRDAIVRPEWDVGIRVYPVSWINWNFVLNQYHGEAVVTSLVPNQIFINKLFAMTMLSLMTTAYPKVLYDKTRVQKWDNRVGAAIAVNGGDVQNIAKILDPAQISPQVSQFMDAAIRYTKDFKGASDTAVGNIRPENTSAIIAVQRAAAMPLELVKQNLYQFVEDSARVMLMLMAQYYGKRFVEPSGEKGKGAAELFDYSVLDKIPLAIKLDVGAASYWSEIAGMQTLDNLLMNRLIEPEDYLERLPRGYIPKLSELVTKIKTKQALQETLERMDAQSPPGSIPTAGVMQGFPPAAGIPVLPGAGEQNV